MQGICEGCGEKPVEVSTPTGWRLCRDCYSGPEAAPTIICEPCWETRPDPAGWLAHPDVPRTGDVCEICDAEWNGCVWWREPECAEELYADLMRAMAASLDRSGDL